MAILEASGLPLLSFFDPLQLLQTRPYDYSAISKQSSAAAVINTAVRPDFIAELTFHRGAISSWLQSLAAAAAATSSPGGSSSSGNAGGSSSAPGALMVPEPVTDGLAALAARLHGLMDLMVAPPPAGGAGEPPGKRPAAAPAFAAAATAGWLRAEWTSALSSKPQRMLRVDSLPQELAMVYTTYAAALRQQAHQRLAEAAFDSTSSGAAAAAPAGAPGNGPELSGGGSPAVSASSSSSSASTPLQAALTAAVGTLRRAAGLYEYLADVLLPELNSGVAAPQADRPLELLPPAARTMQQLCLAEAQALVAAAAAAKGMSSGTQRALHAGAASLCRQAYDAASELAAAAPSGLPASDRLGRLTAASASLHSARAYLCLALDRQKAMEMGEAEASCEECSRLLEAGLRRLDRSDPLAWAQCFKAQQQACSQLFSSVNRDRLAVTYQALPKQPPDAAANAAIRVAADAFQPAPVAPPRPPATDNNRGGCVVM